MVLVKNCFASWRCGLIVMIGAVLVSASMFATSAHASTSIVGTTGASPWSIAIDSNDNIYTPNSGSDTVSKFTSAGASTVSWAAVGSDPYGIAVDSNGTIYVVNRVGCSVSKITSGGAVTPGWASTGAGTYPRAIAVDSNGNVYTANTDTGTVSKITREGVVNSAWGTTGGAGSSPRAIAVDSTGNVYTANNSADTVSKITSAGVSTANWASTGSSTGPSGIAIDSADNVYTNLYYTDAVAKITPGGTVNSTWGSTGSAPFGITVDSADNVYVANTGADTVSKITSAGVSTVAWAATGASTGPRGIAVDSAGNVYTANYTSSTVTKIAADPPSAPTGLVATTSDASTSIAFSAGADNGWVLTNYAYSLDNGSTWTTRNPASVASPIAITGLTNATTNSIKLRAINSGGSGAESSAVSVIPDTVPDAPTALAATIGKGRVSVAFAAGAANGAEITNYEYSIDSGSTWTTRSPASVTSPVTITGLTNGTTYTVKLRAINSVGTSAASSAVSVTPVAAPDAPAALVATAFATDASVSIAFVAGSDNGWAITNYEYSIDSGSTWTTRSPASVTSPVTITGLANGTTYIVTLRAVNSVGTSDPSTAVSVTVPALPTPATPKAVKLSATTVAPGQSLVATFAADTDTTYTISAVPRTTRLEPRAIKTVRGTCSVKTNQKTQKLTARCTIRLKQAGSWLVSVTPVLNGVKGTPATRRVAVRTQAPPRSPATATSSVVG